VSDDERVPVGDWAAVERGLRGFDAAVEADDDRLTLRAGSARFAVWRDGAVEAGMPLHGFEAERVEALGFDHERGRIRLSAGGVDYEFRVP
jgi:hypothetical protein